MGTTPNRGYPYPEDGDQPDGPAQIQALADPIDVDVQALLTDVADLQARMAAKETVPQPGQLVYVGRRVNVQVIENRAALLNATRIAWDSTVYDPLPGGSREAPPNNSRILPPVAGWYRFEGKGAVHGADSPGDTNRSRDCGFVLNGTSVIAGSTARDLVVFPNGGADVVSQTPFASVTLVQLNGSSDYVEMFLQQASGGPLNTVADSDYIPTVTVTYVGPL